MQLFEFSFHFSIFKYKIKHQKIVDIYLNIYYNIPIINLGVKGMELVLLGSLLFYLFCGLEQYKSLI